MRTGIPPLTARPPDELSHGGAEQLIRTVSDIADTMASEAVESEKLGYLSPGTVKALRSHDLWRMRLCREMGGLELPIVEQMRVLSALAERDSASAWCTMVANNAVAVLGATMPSAATDRIFANGVPACSIVAASGGKALRTDGGYTITGTWRLASGIHYAEWIHATALVGGDPSQVLPLALPAQDVTLLDSWHAVGLAATGSNDFSLTDYFLPSELAGQLGNPFRQLRGSRRYDHVELSHLESYEHLAFAIGVGRCALGELERSLALGHAGYHTADREVVQAQLGRTVVQLESVNALAMSVYSRVDAAALGAEQDWTDRDRYLPRALAALGTQVALEAVQLAFQRCRTAGLHRPNTIEKLLRDMSVAATHVMVDDTAYAQHAQHLLEIAATKPEEGSQQDAR